MGKIMISDNMLWFILGMLAAVIINSLPFSDAFKYKTAIRDCERNLPRGEYCIVVGVPEHE